jgi:hypothetical protein
VSAYPLTSLVGVNRGRHPFMSPEAARGAPENRGERWHG